MRKCKNKLLNTRKISYYNKYLAKLIVPVLEGKIKCISDNSDVLGDE